MFKFLLSTHTIFSKTKVPFKQNSKNYLIKKNSINSKNVKTILMLSEIKCC